MVRHGDNAGLQIGPQRRDRVMQIVRKGRDAAAPGKVIADKRDAGKRLHERDGVGVEAWRDDAVGLRVANSAVRSHSNSSTKAGPG